MSYSINIRAASVVAAAALISAEFDTIVEQQPIHAADREAAEKAARSFLDLMGEPPEGHEMSISVSGSISRWLAGATTEAVTGVGVSVSVSLVPKSA